MISQPRIVVLGLSQPYIFIDDCLLITSSSCTRVQTLLTIQAAVQTQRVTVLRTSTKTRIVTFELNARLDLSRQAMT